MSWVHAGPACCCALPCRGCTDFDLGGRVAGWLCVILWPKRDAHARACPPPHKVDKMKHVVTDVYPGKHIVCTEIGYQSRPYAWVRACVNEL